MGAEVRSQDFKPLTLPGNWSLLTHVVCQSVVAALSWTQHTPVLSVSKAALYN